MATTRVDITREIEETYPLLLRFCVSEEQALSLGYTGLQSLVESVAAAHVQLQVPSLTVTVDASVDAAMHGGTDAAITLTFALPTTVTDTAGARIYTIIFEPGSAVSERVLCHGSLTTRARITS